MKKMGSGIGARFRYTNDSDGAASSVVTDQTETGWSYHRGMWKTRKRHCHKREKRRKQKHASARWRGESGRGISKPVFCALRRTNFFRSTCGKAQAISRSLFLSDCDRLPCASFPFFALHLELATFGADRKS